MVDDLNKKSPASSRALGQAGSQVEFSVAFALISRELIVLACVALISFRDALFKCRRELPKQDGKFPCACILNISVGEVRVVTKIGRFKMKAVGRGHSISTVDEADEVLHQVMPWRPWDSRVVDGYVSCRRRCGGLFWNAAEKGNRPIAEIT